MNNREIDKFINDLYDSIEVVHKDYEIYKMNCFIQNNIVYTYVEYWKNNKKYKKVFENKLFDKKGSVVN